MKKLHTTKYLILTPSSRYGEMSVKMVGDISKAKVPGNGVAVKIELEVPASLFKKPQLQAKIVVPEEATTPAIITPEITTSIEELVREKMDINLAINIIDEP